MSNTIFWYNTKLPSSVVKEVQKIAKASFIKGTIGSGQQNEDIRDSEVQFFDCENWVAGWLWYYLQKTNRLAFNYDITDFDGNRLQYTKYSKGQHYTWHKDQDIESFYQCKDYPTSDKRSNDNLELSSEYVRKLSCTLQVSDPKDYEGGELEFEDGNGKIHKMDREQGQLCVFDSRLRHRIAPITKGTRESVVGWAVGPRWR